MGTLLLRETKSLGECLLLLDLGGNPISVCDELTNERLIELEVVKSHVHSLEHIDWFALLIDENEGAIKCQLLVDLWISPTEDRG